MKFVQIEYLADWPYKVQSHSEQIAVLDRDDDDDDTEGDVGWRERLERWRTRVLPVKMELC